MSAQDEQSVTLSDDDIETRRVGATGSSVGDDTGTDDTADSADTGDDSGDTSDASDTGDDSGDTFDSDSAA